MRMDAWYALERLRGAPGLMVFTTVTLGLAIAASAAVFSIIDAVLLRPSPFADAGRLMSLMNVSAQRGHTYPGMSREKLRRWRSESAIFEAVEAYRPTTVVVTGGMEPEEVVAAEMSPGLVATLGVPALHGRIFQGEDAAAGSKGVVLVSAQYWRTRLGADPSAVGRTVDVNGRPHTIVGVMPSRFHFPTLRESMWLPFDPEGRPGPGDGSAFRRPLLPGPKCSGQAARFWRRAEDETDDRDHRRGRELVHCYRGDTCRYAGPSP